MSGHTPGPWSFDGPPDNHIVWSDRENRVCFLAHSDGKNPARDTANARLIAAAPELLEALEKARAVLADEMAEVVDWMEAKRACDAAIAKATGDA